MSTDVTGVEEVNPIELNLWKDSKILDRVVEMSTDPGDVVLDPFGGSGTTFAVCEEKHRYWIGSGLDFADEIVDRLETGELHNHRNDDFVER